MKQFTYGNGIVHTMIQNTRQLPARVIDSGGVVDYDTRFDANGNVSDIYDYANGANYNRHMQYDGLDRLTAAGSWGFGGDGWHRFTYNALDNLTSWKLAGVKDYANYIYTNNRLTGIQNTAGAMVVGLEYDLQGNLANKNGQTYTFDYGNRLLHADGKEHYLYDASGRRVLAWAVGGANILSLYSLSGQMLYNEDYRRGFSEENIYLNGSLLTIRERNQATNTYRFLYQHTDALGSPVAVTDATGAVIKRNFYEPYGAVINQPNYQGIGYTGHVQDGVTGLTYMQQRYYDQQIGRFLANDPITALAEPGANFSRYWYANNNPYAFVDPDGRCVQEPNKTTDKPCPPEKPQPDEEELPSRREQQAQRDWERLSNLGWSISASDLPTPPQGVVDFTAGFGDVLSFNLSRNIRELGEIGSVDYDSGAYLSGELTGVAYTTAMGGAGGVRAAGAKAKGLEFSHWIPNRAGGSRSLLNGNYVTTVKHALSDPFRYRFMPRNWKVTNPLPSAVQQQWNRIPYVLKGLIGGGAYGDGAIHDDN